MYPLRPGRTHRWGEGGLVTYLWLPAGTATVIPDSHTAQIYYTTPFYLVPGPGLAPHFPVAGSALLQGRALVLFIVQLYTCLAHAG